VSIATVGRDVGYGAAFLSWRERGATFGVPSGTEVRIAAARIVRSLRAMSGSSADGLELKYAQQFERHGPAPESLAAGILGDANLPRG
jgi:hypothetical protein